MRRGTTTQRAVSRLVAVGFVAGLAGGLAGCTNYPEPSHLPTPTETVTPSPTPTPTPTPTPDAASVPPERPEAMDVADSAGAEAVAVYFLELFSYVFATNDLTEWRELSHPECIYCADVIRQVEEQAAVGVHTVGGLITVTETSSLEVEPGRWWSVDAEMVQHASQDVDASGQVVREVPEKSFHMDLAVVFEDAQWVIREVSHERTDT
jgi:hypothetical protein